MATMMPPPVFNIPPPSIEPQSLQSGIVPVMPSFNPSLPPPTAFNSSNASVISTSRMAESSSSSTSVGGQNTATIASVSTALALQQRQYRFKPTATLNLAEAEGYGRRLRRNMAQVRRHIDAIASVLNHVEDRVWQNGLATDQRIIQPHLLYSMESSQPNSLLDSPVDCVTTKFVRSAMNKVRCPIYDICWTPEGRRLVTGASSGEFTLWNGTAFNFETILQAHDTAVRAVKWSHNDLWMISADHDGFIKYWQANMNNVTMFQAHKEAVRSVSFCPSDVKFATASDDGTVRVWDFIRCHEERILRGHGSDVRCVDWHPRKALLVSGSRDSQQPVKLWDPRSGQCLATLHDHKNAVMSTLWNENGNWLITGSRDHLVKLYDIRMMKEMMTFRGHKKEVTALSWHPVHEGLFVSGGADGALMFWLVTNDKEIGIIENAHEQAIWSLKWHPLGHILASGSNDNNTKFWTRNKAGDTLEDFYFVSIGGSDYAPSQRVQAAISNANQQHEKAGWENIMAVNSDQAPVPSKPVPEKKPPITAIPGMGLEGDMFDKLRELQSTTGLLPTIGGEQSTQPSMDTGGIPGLGGIVDTGGDSGGPGGRKTLLKQPPPKKAQRQFERVWNVNSRLQGSMLGPADEDGPPITSDIIDYRKPKPSLLGAPPPSMDVGPPPPQMNPPSIPSLLGPLQQPLTSWNEQSGIGGESWRAQGGEGLFMPADHPHQRHRQVDQGYLLPTPSDRPANQWFYAGGREERELHGDVDLRQVGPTVGTGDGGGWGMQQYEDLDYRDIPTRGDQGPGHSRTNIRDPRMQPRTQQQQSSGAPESDYRFQNWMDPSGTSQPQSILDRRPQQSMIDPRRQPQSLLSLSVPPPPPNGSGYVHNQMGTRPSDDQDSDQESGTMGGGMNRNAPTNPKRKWKQEYEAEEAQGTGKRWALSMDDDSPPDGPYTQGDTDDRHIWGRQANQRR